MRKRIVAKNKIYKGNLFTEENICVKRNDIGMIAPYWDLVVGREATKDYLEDTGIQI